jgi:methylene-tetrahydromethanopterin dehydrogenase
VLAARAGADTAIVSHQNRQKAQQSADLCAQRYGVELEGVDGSSDEGIIALMSEAEVVFGSAAAGVQVLSRRHLEGARRLAVACDVNAVPPDGIEGIGVMNDGVPIEGAPNNAVGIGALEVGNVKYHTQQALLRRMIEGDGPQYLSFEQALELARDNV